MRNIYGAQRKKRELSFIKSYVSKNRVLAATWQALESGYLVLNPRFATF